MIIIITINITYHYYTYKLIIGLDSTTDTAEFNIKRAYSAFEMMMNLKPAVSENSLSQFIKSYDYDDSCSGGGGDVDGSGVGVDFVEAFGEFNYHNADVPAL